MTTSNRTVILGNYAVAYIDLLGQTNALSKLRVPRPGENVAPVLHALKESAGVVKSIRDAFRFFYEQVASGPSPEILATIPPEKHDEFRRLRAMPAPILWGFSDSFLIACPLTVQSGQAPSGAANGLHGMLMALGGISKIALSRGVPLRGGMALGVGINLLSDTEIYGPVLAEAYRLESKISSYPRIVLHENVTEYLDHLRGLTWSDAAATHIINGVAERATQLICDSPNDGRPMVHFLSDLIPKLPNFENAGAEAAQWVRKSMLEHASHGRWRLARRYAHLGEYFSREGMNAVPRRSEIFKAYTRGLRRTTFRKR